MGTLSTVKPAEEVVYPSSTEEPMAQTEWHRDLAYLLLYTLIHFFRGVDRVCVSGDVFVYYERGNDSRMVAPDVFVARGVERRERDRYLIWEEARGPEFVIEVISDSTRRADMGRKFELYRDVLKVGEYYVFDPDGEHLTPRLQGWRHQGRAYVPIEAVAGRLPSQVTGLHLEASGRTLRFWNPATGAWVPTEPELRQAAVAARDAEALARQVAEAARAKAAARADAAEAETSLLRAEIERLRGGKPAP